MAFDRKELEDAFRTYWRTGAAGEDWDAWANLFTEDCHYERRARLGQRAGRDQGRTHVLGAEEIV